MLAIPEGVSGQVPAAIIVGGSGTHNMDGQAQGMRNPIYRDIAHYLAEHGIATMRYDRRLYVYAEAAMEAFGGSLTVREEIIEDTLLAVEILRADPRVDSDRIYIIGHSFGGQLAPRIHAEADFAGLILMAASPRNLLEISTGQLRETVAMAIEAELLTEEDLAGMIAEFDGLDELFASLVTMPDEEARVTPVPLLGAAAYYFKDLELHSFADYVQGVTVPIFVMQADRDFQIRSDLDFALLQALLIGRGNVTFQVYADLNHAFIHTTAETFLEHADSIMTGGSVDTQALQDIVDWILGQ